MHSTGKSGPERHETRLPEGLELGQDLLLVLGPGLIIAEANSAAADALALSMEQLLGADLCRFAADPSSARTLFEAAQEQGSANGHLLELRSGSQRIYLLCTATAIPGTEMRVQVKAENLIGKRSEVLVRPGDEDRFRIAFEFAKIGLAMVDLYGNIFEANEPLAEMFGYTREELKRMSLLDVWAPAERRDAIVDLRDVVRGARCVPVFERRYINKPGEILFAEVTRGLARSKTGEPLYFVVTFRDITQSKKLQALLEERASTDPLTGALNRSGIEERAHFELMRSDRYGVGLSVVMIDIDHFKVVNDTYGHQAGDRVLRSFCDIVRSCLRSTDMLGRWGGEEFIALLPETTLKGSQQFCERLRATLGEFRFEGGILQVRASMGIAGYRSGEQFSAVVGRADAVLYRAKEAGRNRAIVDDEDMKRERSKKPQASQLSRLQWRASSRTGDPEIDAEHIESFRLTNELIGAVAEKGDDAAILPLAHQLVDHLCTHFEHENGLLRSVQYPGAEVHIGIHRNLVARVQQLTEQLEKGEGSATDILAFLIYEVVARHLLVEDRKFFPWVKPKPE